MKVAVTGHTSGIGKAIAERFQLEGYTVTGFSRSTGHDLSDSKTLFRIAGEASDHDIFFNCAYAHDMGFAQTNLLYAVRDLWQADKTKTIVSISSVASDGISLERQFYPIHKAALDKASEQLARASKCRVLNVKPGLVETRMSNWATGIAKLQPSEIAETCLWMVRQPSHTMISTITILPREENGLTASLTRKKSQL